MWFPTLLQSLRRNAYRSQGVGFRQKTHRSRARQWQPFVLKHSLPYLAALCVTLGMALGAHADWFYDFQTAPPPSFITGSIPPSGTFSSTVDGGVLRLFDTTPPAQGGAFLGFGNETSQVFTDVRVTGTLNPTGTMTDNIVVLTARLDLANNLYTAGIAYADGPNGLMAGTLQISKVVGGGEVKHVLSTDASQGSQPPLTDLARSYFLQFDVVGNHLTARVFDVKGGTQLLVVNYTDSGDGGPPFESGWAGVASVTLTGAGVDGTFGPVGATAIPGWFYDFQTAPPASFITASGPPSGTFSSTVGGGVLRLFDTRQPAGGGAFIGVGIETSQVFADVRLTGTLNPTGTTDNILQLSRGDTQGHAYGAGIDFAAGVLQVVKLVGGPVEFVRSTDASQGSQPPLTDLARSYFLQLDVVGNQLTARVFDVEGGTQLLIVNYTDTGVGGPPLTSGMGGVSAVSTGGRVDGTFGPVRATAILP